jgi:hypothetical protein
VWTVFAFDRSECLGVDCETVPGDVESEGGSS